MAAHSDGPGRGALFTVTLPAAPREPAAAPPRVERAAVRGRRVLIVEDTADAADSLADILGLWGHQVTVARDGASGLALARELRPEVVLCDIGLPGELDGYGVATALRHEPATAAAQLVALTGYARPEDRRRALESGFDAHLAKPLDLAALRQLLAEPPASATDGGGGASPA